MLHSPLDYPSVSAAAMVGARAYKTCACGIARHHGGVRLARRKPTNAGCVRLYDAIFALMSLAPLRFVGQRDGADSRLSEPAARGRSGSQNPNRGSAMSWGVPAIELPTSSARARHVVEFRKPLLSTHGDVCNVGLGPSVSGD